MDDSLQSYVLRSLDPRRSDDGGDQYALVLDHAIRAIRKYEAGVCCRFRRRRLCEVTGLTGVIRVSLRGEEGQ